MANKLTSAVTLSPIDYPNLPVCTENDTASVSVKNLWDNAISRLHGDFVYPIHAVSIFFGYDMFCARACDVVLQPSAWNKRIQQEYSYNLVLDGLPAISKIETEYVLLFPSNRKAIRSFFHSFVVFSFSQFLPQHEIFWRCSCGKQAARSIGC
jgi:hypothetical protein